MLDRLVNPFFIDIFTTKGKVTTSLGSTEHPVRGQTSTCRQPSILGHVLRIYENYIYIYYD